MRTICSHYVRSTEFHTSFCFHHIFCYIWDKILLSSPGFKAHFLWFLIITVPAFCRKTVYGQINTSLERLQRLDVFYIISLLIVPPTIQLHLSNLNSMCYADMWQCRISEVHKPMAISLAWERFSNLQKFLWKWEGCWGCSL